MSQGKISQPRSPFPSNSSQKISQITEKLLYTEGLNRQYFNLSCPKKYIYRVYDHDSEFHLPRHLAT